MRVQFLVDYRGKLTCENYYVTGQVAEFEPAIAQALIDEGRAVLVPDVTPDPTPEIAPAQPARPKRKQQSGGGVL